MNPGPILAVAAGSAIGGAARYLVAMSLAGRAAVFPVGTLAVNVVGGFALGVFVQLLGQPPASATPPSATWLFLAVGLCGGFTTFSAFSLDAVRLFQAGESPRAVLYIGASVGLAIAALYAGLFAGRMLARGA